MKKNTRNQPGEYRGLIGWDRNHDVMGTSFQWNVVLTNHHFHSDHQSWGEEPHDQCPLREYRFETEISVGTGIRSGKIPDRRIGIKRNYCAVKVMRPSTAVDSAAPGNAINGFISISLISGKSTANWLILTMVLAIASTATGFCPR